ncbi:MAG: prephenate dehydratase, partial [Coxiellaceae bacterium]|nr:prephenate dehydratase [Coxiellaceae bacterium]
MITIGVQGDIGSFSEQAGHAFAKRQKLEKYDMKYLVNSENVLASVNDKDIDFGVFAIENAQGGVVIESIKAMATYRFHITDMFHIMVEQNLLTLPNITAGEITSIHSHQQALRQCREYLAEHFWSCPLVEEEDTAKSAKALKEGKLAKTAAV